jgi:antibiotic biosynthesis monooxygenase (ABM) superfamily enzyme
MSAQDGKAVTIVTQTRVEPGKGGDFARWQQRNSEAVAAQPGFVKETVMPPSPPYQVDWVILQRFASPAVTWLRSVERQRLVAEAQSILVGQDSGARRAGRLAHHLALRFGSEFADLAGLA